MEESVRAALPVQGSQIWKATTENTPLFFKAVCYQVQIVSLHLENGERELSLRAFVRIRRAALWQIKNIAKQAMNLQNSYKNYTTLWQPSDRAVHALYKNMFQRLLQNPSLFAIHRSAYLRTLVKELKETTLVRLSQIFFQILDFMWTLISPHEDMIWHATLHKKKTLPASVSIQIRSTKFMKHASFLWWHTSSAWDKSKREDSADGP